MLLGRVSLSVYWLLGNNFPYLISPPLTCTVARTSIQLVQVGALCGFQAAAVFAGAPCSVCEPSLGKGHPEPTLHRLLFLQPHPSTFLDNCLEYGTLSRPAGQTEPGETGAVGDPQAGQRCPMLLLLLSQQLPPHLSSFSRFQSTASQSQAVLALCSAE